MGFFNRDRGDELDPKLRPLQVAIQNRGQAQLDEARAVTSEFAESVLAEAGATDDDTARRWLWDRIRFFIIIGCAPGWMDYISPIPESAELRGEFTTLARDWEQYDASVLVAWWWHLSPDLFQPLMANQFQEMRGALVDGIGQARQQGLDLSEQLTDWPSFFNG